MSSLHPVELVGNTERVRVSASDVANAGDCPRHLALKVRPEVKLADWQRRFADSTPFPVGDVLDLLHRALHQKVEPQDSVLWVRERVEAARVHRLVRPYLRVAVQNALEAHWELSDEVGGFTDFVRNPEIGTSDRRLWVWGFVHSTADGIREVRRYRIGPARPPGDAADLRWTQTAARVAAGVAFGPSVSRVRVVEVGLADGSIEVHFDGSRDDAVTAFVSSAQATAQSLGDLQTAIPGYECASCKATGGCEALIDVSGALGQGDLGLRTRSVSASGLDRYATCPAQWLLSTDLHLPRTDDVSEAQQRGLWIHQWLEHTHRAGVCRIDDPGPLDPHEFAIALPYLRRHVATCPLATDGAELLAADENLYGFDATAGVVCVAKPDLVYRIGDRVIVREFKTSLQAALGGAGDVFGRSVQVPLLISLLAAGVTDAFGGKAASVEVEVLTPGGAELFTWDVDDEATLAHARRQVAEAVQGWHVDDVWQSNPGPQCTWCPVQEWCPDAHRAATGATAPAVAFDPEPDDESPPF
jgi:hypothetical protein